MREVTRMGAIDHVVARIAPGSVVYLGNGDGKRLASGQGPVGLDREGEGNVGQFVERLLDV